jgi:hypothetical protein
LVSVETVFAVPTRRLGCALLSRRRVEAKAVERGLDLIVRDACALDPLI